MHKTHKNKQKIGHAQLGTLFVEGDKSHIEAKQQANISLSLYHTLKPVKVNLFTKGLTSANISRVCLFETIKVRNDWH
jgi:hypothetical protein